MECKERDETWTKKAWAWALFQNVPSLYDSGSTRSRDTSCVGKILFVCYSVMFHYIFTTKYTVASFLGTPI